MTSPHRSARSIATALCAAALAASPALAHADTGEARRHADEARSAADAGDHDRALELLEQAYVADPSALYLYQRILVLEQMGRPELALQVLREHRDELMAHPDINDVVVIEQRLQSVDPGPTQARDDRQTREPAVAAEADTGASGADVLGWSLVGAGTAVAATGVVLALVGADELDRVACSGSAVGTADCEGVEPFPETTEAGLRQREDDAQLQVNAGLGLALVGAGLLGWGVWELTSDDASAPETARITLSPRSRGAQATFELRFQGF